MAKKAKVLTHAKAGRIVQVLDLVAAQQSKNPISKAEVALAMDCKTGELTDEYKTIEARDWADRRTGPDSRGIYLKITAKGRAALKAWALLYS